MSDKGFSATYNFLEAVPVWEKGSEKAMNRSLLFRGIAEATKKTLLHIACHSRYTVFVNGEFAAEGPARAAHGYYRVDEYDLTRFLTPKKNVIVIIAAGYNVNSFCYLDEPSFLCAEIVNDGKVIYATGSKEFEVIPYLNRLTRVMRYSFQRPFTESYVYDAGCDSFFLEADEKFKNAVITPTKNKVFIERGVPYPQYPRKNAVSVIKAGILVPSKEKRRYSDRAVDDIDDALKGYKVNELECEAINELLGFDVQVLENELSPFSPQRLGTNCFAVYDMGKNTSGLISLTVTVTSDTVLYAVFGERLNENGVPSPGAGGCVNVVKWALQGGRSYDLLTFEPYTAKYISLVSMYAGALVSSLSFIEVKGNEALFTSLKKMPDAALQKVYDAAVETFAQNAVDIFTDCPSRERAGWLCDSFFTARTEKALTGESRIEHNFLENFLLADSFKKLPDGMLPMCYPADHYDGTFIPNWSMWFVLELKEYLERSGDRPLCDIAKEKIYKLLNYFKGFENSDGLLEKLESWVFIEWSQANAYTQDINYPTNMLYAMFKDTIAALYSDRTLSDEAAALRETIRKQSFDGVFFCDNADYDASGKLMRTGNHTETAQYYAFFSGTADKASFPELWKKLCEDFGPARKESGLYPDAPESNAFIGNYLRLELLFNDGQYEKLLAEAEAFFGKMAETTGTLWENMTDCASCCHGFTSHCVYWLNKIFA